MAEQNNLVNVVIVCPSCKRDFSVKMDMNDPETAMLMDYAQSTCKGCGNKFRVAGNIDHSRTTVAA